MIGTWNRRLMIETTPLAWGNVNARKDWYRRKYLHFHQSLCLESRPLASGGIPSSRPSSWTQRSFVLFRSLGEGVKWNERMKWMSEMSEHLTRGSGLPKAWVLHPSSQGLVSQPYRRFLLETEVYWWIKVVTRQDWWQGNGPPILQSFPTPSLWWYGYSHLWTQPLSLCS